jgi:GDPmannose 4,6-dehydratase
MTAIIWGVSGQDGYYLSCLLKQQGIKVVGVSRSGNGIQVDITRYEEVTALVKEHQPQYIFHFAAVSTTRHSAWKENHDAITTGSLHILEAVKQYSAHTKVFLSGSGLQFLNRQRPIKETDPFDASSIYAAARISSVYLGRYYRSLGIKVYIGYFFNHDSPLRSEKHINKKIIEAAKSIAAGSKEKFPIGDLHAQKEFGFAGDIVDAVWLLVQQDTVMEAVIGTGRAYSIEEWLSVCFSLAGLNWKDHVVKAEGFVPEYKILVSDPATIFSLGWKPKVSMEDLAQMMS